ncbi:HIT domain-containing protein [Metallosphaera tengchongensis]|uniref:HIT domain-containing protein n=1 Tax=Metallosphaera tengchongensis TaxID=1532350 RepID=A0A6N0NYW8_9CREN|nr:HIT domain-containing protein [Metallosphaera tengchongensis]QKR01013.1 HIT domain-containing protein [Metallosphaera tengchongensis]
MDHLWAPWRSKYIADASKGKQEGCLFCRVTQETMDKENLLVCRGRKSFIILNKYPYNPGHLMVVPYRHLPSLELLEKDEAMEIFAFTSRALKVLREIYSPDGFNVGINIGRIAGAGIDQHVHVHVVPRWSGDANFMPVIGDTKVLPETLDETYKKLRTSSICGEEVFDR